MAETNDVIHESVKRELDEAFSSGGVRKFTDCIKKKNSDWQKTPLNIAVTGASGVGKSSFINAIRGITADDEGGAPVEVVEATKKITRYPDPKNSSLVFWDLPGVGTPTFPRSNYLKQVDFEQFEFFLILSAGRFREDDLWLAKEIRGLKKNFHFVRTQMDLEVDKDKKGHPKTHSKAKVIEKVRNDCQKNLEDNNLTSALVFLIDNYSPMDFDFNELTKTLIDEAPGHKKEAMSLSISVLTDGVIERKVEALKERIYLVSLWSAAAGAIPIPGLGTAVDLAILLEEVNFYKSQLGLDDEKLMAAANFLNTDVTRLQAKLDLQIIKFAATSGAIAKLAADYKGSHNIAKSLLFKIPIFGNIISSEISYGASVAVLSFILSVCSDDAIKLYKEMVNSLN